MPRTIETTVYTYAELKALGNEKATAKALEWLGECAGGFEWWDSIYDDAKNIGCRIDGFDLGRGRSIDFGFEWDGISVALAIRANHGETCDTYKLAVEFIGKHDEYHGLNGKITLADAVSEAEGNTLADYQALRELEEEWEEIERDFEKALGEDYLSTLQREYEYTQNEEYLAEMAEANEYTFTATGKREG